MEQTPVALLRAALIGELETRGIGRPSTYATIVGTLLSRGYALREKRALVPTVAGKEVLDLLVGAFPDTFDVRFTSNRQKINWMTSRAAGPIG